ncbi:MULTISPECIES: fimbria/pilus outer membrane usher protein [unclassified Burkholderia]|uniref:fimbria/pilus outer membrane usher protein n=1 Tax=Burkholderia TaxID=32008 RepID=UPI0032AEF427
MTRSYFISARARVRLYVAHSALLAGAAMSRLCARDSGRRDEQRARRGIAERCRTVRNQRRAGAVRDQRRGGATGQMSVTGTVGQSNTLSYGVNANTGGGSTSGGGNVQYRSPLATLSGSASGGSRYSSVSAGVSGALVGHVGGITLANDLGDTVALIEARDAVGARVTNGSDVRIDRHGYAVLPYLTPYQMNTIDLDPKGIPLDVEMLSTSQQVAPRANSVVKVKFATTTGRAALLTVRQPNGAPVPFGATISDAQGNSKSVVGQGGNLFMRGADDSGTLVAKWGNRSTESCTFSYQLPVHIGKREVYSRFESTCNYSPRTNAKQTSSVANSAPAIEQHPMDETSAGNWLTTNPDRNIDAKANDR